MIFGIAERIESVFDCRPSQKLVCPHHVHLIHSWVKMPLTDCCSRSDKLICRVTYGADSSTAGQTGRPRAKLSYSNINKTLQYTPTELCTQTQHCAPALRSNQIVQNHWAMTDKMGCKC